VVCNLFVDEYVCHQLRARNNYIGVITNADERMRKVMRELEFPEELFQVEGGGKDLIVPISGFLYANRSATCTTLISGGLGINIRRSTFKIFGSLNQ